MPEHLTDQRQGRAIAQQPRSQRVTQRMRATMRTQVKPDQRHANEITDTLRTGEAIEGGLALNEHTPGRTCRARLLQYSTRA